MSKENMIPIEIFHNPDRVKESDLRDTLGNELEKLKELGVPYEFKVNENDPMPVSLRNKYYNAADHFPVFFEFYREAVGITDIKHEINNVMVPYLKSFNVQKIDF